LRIRLPYSKERRKTVSEQRLLFALLLAVCCSAQEAPKISNAEQEIRALETIRLKSPTNTEVWSGNVAKDALFQLGNGSVASKKDLLAHMQHQVMEDSLEMSDTMFSQIGDAAVFSYVFRRTHHDDGRPDTHQHIRRTLVYQHTGSGWQMIASAVAIIPYADLEARPVDRKILETYLGVWTAAPASSTITVTLEGGKLMAQGSADTEKYEFQALSDSTFVSQGDPQLITFEKGPEGKVTRMLLRDVGGSVDVYERSLTDRK
jgi:Domain of unknown function (DUF3471)/Domain of unknown function (DUF4440)